MTEADLVERCEFWQRRLRLCDWTVRLRIRRHHAMGRKDSLAYVEVFESKKEAHLTFLDPGDHDPDGWPQESMEQSLVHELLHIHFWPFNPEEDTPAWTAMEQATDALARAFCAAEEKSR